MLVFFEKKVKNIYEKGDSHLLNAKINLALTDDELKDQLRKRDFIEIL